MKPYRDTDGDSNVAAYEYGDDWITVKFKDGSAYTYRSSRIGPAHLSTMKRLADSGEGLNAYINKHRVVRQGFD